MPNFDGTGPAGRGSGTGRGLGPCGTGMACRRGRGFGLGRFCFTEQDLKDRKEWLKAELQALEKEDIGDR